MRKSVLCLVVLLGACGGSARENPAAPICAACSADQLCVYVTVMAHSTTTSETARCLARDAACSQEALTQPGNCTPACQTQFCGAGGPAACSYHAGPSTLPAAEVTIFCHWG